MSLINQMLKDLEDRSKSSIHPEAVLAGLQAISDKKPSKKRRHLVLFVGMLCLIFLGALSGFQYYRTHSHSHLTRVKTVAIPAEVIKPERSPQLASWQPKTLPTMRRSAVLTGMSMQAHGKMTYLRFLLNEEVTYRLDSDPLEHSLTLTLNQTRLGVNLPPLDFGNSALRNLQVGLQSKDELKIVMKLKPEAKLSNLEMNKESKYPELQADFLLEAPPLAATEPLFNAKVDRTQKEEPSGNLKKVPVEMSIDERYQNALNSAESGELDRAIQQLSALVDHYPSYHAAREALIRFLMQSGHKDQAEDLLASGLRLQPYYPPFVEIKARLWVDEGRVQEALRLLKKAPPALSSNPDYYAFLAALYQRLGQFSAAENLYQQLTALHPEKGVFWLGLGVTEESLGKNEQAMEAYARADQSPDLDPQLRGYVGTRLRG